MKCKDNYCQVAYICFFSQPQVCSSLFQFSKEFPQLKSVDHPSTDSHFFSYTNLENIREQPQWDKLHSEKCKQEGLRRQRAVWESRWWGIGVTSTGTPYNFWVHTHTHDLHYSSIM